MLRAPKRNKRFCIWLSFWLKSVVKVRAWRDDLA